MNVIAGAPENAVVIGREQATPKTLNGELESVVVTGREEETWNTPRGDAERAVETPNVKDLANVDAILGLNENPMPISELTVYVAAPPGRVKLRTRK